MTGPSGVERERSRLAEEVRLRHLYRSLILRGCLRLPREAALPLIGPDCAYHLYSVEGTGWDCPAPAAVGRDEGEDPEPREA